MVYLQKNKIKIPRVFTKHPNTTGHDKSRLTIKDVIFTTPVYTNSNERAVFSTRASVCFLCDYYSKKKKKKSHKRVIIYICPNVKKGTW